MDEKHAIELKFEPSTPENIVVESIKYDNGYLKINNETKILGISQRVWDYQIGGYQVIDKWFKEHKGQSLSLDSFSHIENIVGNINATIEIQNYLKSLHK